MFDAATLKVCLLTCCLKNGPRDPEVLLDYMVILVMHSSSIKNKQLEHTNNCFPARTLCSMYRQTQAKCGHVAFWKALGCP